MDDAIKLAFIKGMLAGEYVTKQLNDENEMLRPSITSPWTCALLAQCLVRADGPHLEIGTRYGASAALASLFTKHLITCVDPMETIKDWYTDEYIGDTVKFKNNMETLGITDRVELVVAYSNPLPVAGPFATTFIDGDHSTKGAYADFMNVKDITTHYIIWDDMIEESVYKAVMKALRNKQWRLAFSNYTTAVMVNRDIPGDWDESLKLGGTEFVAREATEEEMKNA